MDITNKDAKTRIVFEDVAIFLETDMTLAMVNIANSADMEKVKGACLVPMVTELKSVLSRAGEGF